MMFDAGDTPADCGETPRPKYRILYVGCLANGQTCLQRLHVLRDLGHSVVSIDSRPAHIMRAETKLLSRVQRRLFGPADRAGANGQILSAVYAQPFDILWIDKGLTISPLTLREAKGIQPGCRIVGYSLDDMTLRHNTSRRFRAHLPHYDLFFTNKSFGVADLQQMGCRRTEFVANGYDRATHRPLAVNHADRERLGGPVGFIGDYEAERARSMARLAERGVPVRVWGPNWDRFRKPPPLMRVERRAILGHEYAHAICAFDINLGFLRKDARDLQTTRSVEIPACGAFMLAERSAEHAKLFKEGHEAEYFEGDDELYRKARYYLEHPEERVRIAVAGRSRCITGRYSNHDRLSHMIQFIMNKVQ